MLYHNPIFTQNYLQLNNKNFYKIMKKLFQIIFICIICFFSTALKAQVSINKEKSQRSTISEVEGTIQVEFLKSFENIPFSLTPDIIEKIDALRNTDKITYLPISLGCRLKIFPLNQIKQKEFKTEDYVVVDRFEN
jgi:hypothetical protein